MLRRTTAALAALLLLLTGCDVVGSLPAAGGGTTVDRVPEGTVDGPTARTLLTRLAVAEPGRMSGYARDCDNGAGCVFGRPWEDVDGDGCDQRSQVLARDLTDVRRKEGRCAVESGSLLDPYTGDTVTTVSKIQIDHVVPLAEMWRSGAAAWPRERRVAAANDLRNLLAVQGGVNQSKGDQTPDEWMPPNGAFACQYGRVYVTVKAEYGLSVTAAERGALERALATCAA
ncbi:HNH endonuclease family protein [Saccharothrix yanglingensis]|uniref:HNH endonuclease n=1 Tax=Saccharothrix yanglingensis TaxID=659496 RepID=A0ABU0WWY4_9PSEU|nr:HNH endonuclease family protein [Saccharothrix yanglingensis]MDQ2584365.1 HNH endonuclease [Saccharothrix yanglingensis]